jgi:hypothetical protein
MFVARLAIALALVSAFSTFAQPLLKPATFTLKIDKATLVDVLDRISRATDIKIEVDEAVSADLKNRELVSVNFENTRVEDALRFLTTRSALTMEVLDEATVRIRAKK